VGKLRVTLRTAFSHRQNSCNLQAHVGLVSVQQFVIVKADELLKSHQMLQLKGYVKELNILIYFFFPPITQWCSVSDVLFTGGRGVSDFSILKYYQLNINYSVNILSKC